MREELYSRLYFRSRVSRTRLHTRVQGRAVYPSRQDHPPRDLDCIVASACSPYSCTHAPYDLMIPVLYLRFLSGTSACRPGSVQRDDALPSDICGWLFAGTTVCTMQYSTSTATASACSSEITLRVPSDFGQPCGGTRYLCTGLLLHTNLRTMYTRCSPSRQLLSVLADCKLSALDREIIALSFLPSELYPGVGRCASSVALIPYGISCCFGTYAPYEIVPSSMSLTWAYHVVQQRALTPRGPRAQACSWRRRRGPPLPAAALGRGQLVQIRLRRAWRHPEGRAP